MYSFCCKIIFCCNVKLGFMGHTPLLFAWKRFRGKIPLSFKLTSDFCLSIRIQCVVIFPVFLSHPCHLGFSRVLTMKPKCRQFRTKRHLSFFWFLLRYSLPSVLLINHYLFDWFKLVCRVAQITKQTSPRFTRNTRPSLLWTRRHHNFPLLHSFLPRPADHWRFLWVAASYLHGAPPGIKPVLRVFLFELIFSMPVDDPV